MAPERGTWAIADATLRTLNGKGWLHFFALAQYLPIAPFGLPAVRNCPQTLLLFTFFASTPRNLNGQISLQHVLCAGSAMLCDCSSFRCLYMPSVSRMAWEPRRIYLRL